MGIGNLDNFPKLFDGAMAKRLEIAVAGE